MDAPQPQKERGQPAGRPPTTCPWLLSTAAIAFRYDVVRCSKLARAEYDVGRGPNCGPEKSHGIVTLHSDAVTDRSGGTRFQGAR